MMTATVAALVFVGLLLTVIGLFVAGSLSFVALGVVSLIAGGFLQSLDGRAARRSARCTS
jgi:hypothetical protein